MKKTILLLTLTAVAGFTSCDKKCDPATAKPGDECYVAPDPCLEVKTSRDNAENSYNTNANLCLNTYVPACMNYPTYGDGYRTNFNMALPLADENGRRGNRIDSLGAAIHADTTIQNLPIWSSLPENFKLNVSKAGETARNAKTYYASWQDLIAAAKECEEK